MADVLGNFSLLSDWRHQGILQLWVELKYISIMISLCIQVQETRQFFASWYSIGSYVKIQKHAIWDYLTLSLAEGLFLDYVALIHFLNSFILIINMWKCQALLHHR